MITVRFYAASRAVVYRRSIVDIILGRTGDDRRAYLANGGRWHFDCSGRWVGIRIQRAIDDELRRVRLLVRATAPPS